jgi:hypothetical protein
MPSTPGMLRVFIDMILPLPKPWGFGLMGYSLVVL